MTTRATDLKRLCRIAYPGDEVTLRSRGQEIRVKLARVDSRHATLLVGAQEVVLAAGRSRPFSVGGRGVEVRCNRVREGQAHLVYSAPEAVTIDRTSETTRRGPELPRWVETQTLISRHRKRGA